jgi:acyl dehydratase
VTTFRTGVEPNIIHANFDLDALAAWTPTVRFFLDPELCERYAAATNETDPRRWTTTVAPPVVGVIATVAHVHQVLQTNLPEQVITENRSVHGEHDIHYHRLMVPGSTLLVRGRMYGVHPKSTGTIFVTLVELTDSDTGQLVQEQFFVNFLRDVVTDESIGEMPPSHRLPDVAGLGESASVTSYVIDTDQTYRYADASRDHSVYHLDDDAARAAGFNGIIVHGLCTMAFASRAVVQDACGGDATQLRRLAVRFSRPMYPGHTMTTSLWAPSADGGQGEPFRFLVSDDTSGTVITDGLAEVGPVGKEGRAR